MPVLSEPKSERFQHRASQDQHRVITAAARSRHVSVTYFILESAYSKAEQVLADENVLSLNARQWRKFVEALERPPQPKRRLARLMREASVLESRR